MKLPMLPELLKQFGRKTSTNAFPARHLPPTVTGFLDDVEAGRAEINPPIPIPEKGFKGKLAYNYDTCTGCGLCVRFCPAHALELMKPIKKIRVMIGQCIGCEQCTLVCPEGSLTNSDEFLTADTDRYSENLVLRGPGNKPEEENG